MPAALLQELDRPAKKVPKRGHKGAAAAAASASEAGSMDMGGVEAAAGEGEEEEEGGGGEVRSWRGRVWFWARPGRLCPLPPGLCGCEPLRGQRVMALAPFIHC